MHRSLAVATWLLLVLAAAAVRPAAAANSSSHDRALALARRGLGRLAGNTIDSRRQAVQDLEEAGRLAPRDAAIGVALARAYYAVGFLQRSRRTLERVLEREPDDAAAHFWLGRVWRRDWLLTLDPRSFRNAEQELVRATILDTLNTDAWLEVEPLFVVQGNIGAALAAAFRAARSDPERLDTHLAVASVCWRVGLAHDADSIFRAVIPRLRAGVRERFEDVAPMVSAEEAETLRQMTDEEHAAFADRFWKARDPDPGTSENGARLEFWSRVTQAYFLYFDPRRDGWDARGNVYVRFGPPDEMRIDPVDRPHRSTFVIGSDFPTHVQVWSYRALGIRVEMDDLTLEGSYTPPIVRAEALDPADPQLVGTDARRPPE